jgi:hypothetical protein
MCMGDIQFDSNSHHIITHKLINFMEYTNS